MFAALTKSKRRLATTLEDALVQEGGGGGDEEAEENNPPLQRPLRGVVACLTGMAPDQKNQYHEWITTLGGTYTRDFQTSRNTHLVAQEPSGQKYNAAAKTPNIHVVAPSWLETCRAQKCRVDEREHSWKKRSSSGSGKRKSKEEQGEPSLSPTNKKRKKPKRQLLALLQYALTSGGNSNSNCSHGDNPSLPNTLFSSCQFHVVGFEQSSTTNEEERVCMGKLIRRGMGTIFWEYHEGITHLIVHDDCSDAIRESISKAKVESFDENITIVSPWWVIESWEKRTLVCPADFPAQLAKRKKASSSATATMKKKKDDSATTEKVSNLLRGYLFVMLRISNPPKWMIDYDIKELEKSVRSHGGQILSLKLLEALKSDQAAKGQNNNAAQDQQQQQPSAQRKCHVICWGGNANPQQFALHPLLSQVQRRGLCECVMATPNWLQTCTMEQKIVPQSYLPQLFQPQSWPWRRIVVPSDSATTDNHKKEEKVNKSESSSTSSGVRISVTGFTGHRRTAIIQAIQAMGASYDDSMRQNLTTHLICADRAATSKHNQKFQKAKEWGIHIISVEWLYHLLQYGVKKSDSNCEGEAYSESRFCLASSDALEEK